MKLIILFSLVSVTLGAILTPTKPPCVVESADIGFIVDASGSVDMQEWSQSLLFVTTLIQNFKIGANSVKVAMIQFSDGARMEFNFNRYTTVQSLQNAIASTRKIKGNTNTAAALDLARLRLFTTSQGMRPGVPNLLFVITDGASNRKARTLASAKLLHQTGITVFAVGVSGAQTDELRGIASDPKYVYQYNDFSKLAEIQSQFAKEACRVAVKLVSTTKPTTPATTTTKPTPPATTTRAFQGCIVNRADIVFSVDSSSSVGEANFNLTKIFLITMLDALDLTTNRVGMLMFNDKVYPEFELNQKNNVLEKQRAIQTISYNSGKGTVISGALKHMREESFSTKNGDRLSVPNIGIIVTDGQSKDPYKTQYEANLTKAAGILLFVVGVGDQINQQELETMASSRDLVYFVKNFEQLENIRDELANVVCKGYTVPPTTTAAACICRDKETNCAGYGRDICLNPFYRNFAKEACPLYCDLCPPGCAIEVKPPRRCVDLIPDCDQKLDLCTPKYEAYALENCPRFCNYCDKLLPTSRWTQPPTTPTTKTTLRTTKPTTPPTTPFVPCDSNCYDKDRNCTSYDKSQCNLSQYKDNCALYCGHCTPKADCIRGSCADKLDCSVYYDSDCVEHKAWAQENCPVRCGLCPGMTPVGPPECKDKEDCSVYGKDMCTDYKDFAKEKCSVYCGFCTPTVTTPKPPCVDVKTDCNLYQKTDCTVPKFRKFMLANCRKFCDLCDADV